MTVTPAIAARPLAIEDPSNRWIVHPLADRLLAPAIRSGIAPNAVSIAGLCFGIASGVAYAHWHRPGAALLGFVLMIGWHICDGLDGKLARATGRTSAFGRLIDGICDYLVFFAVLLPIAFSLPDRSGTLTLCFAAGACHAVQAAWYEGERDAWRRRAAGVFLPVERPVAGHVFERFYNWAETRLGGGARPIDAALVARPVLLPAYLGASAPWLRAMAVVGANGRTLMIFLAVAAGHPRWYWYWEMFALSALALLIAWRLRRREAQIAQQPVARDDVARGAARVLDRTLAGGRWTKTHN